MTCEDELIKFDPTLEDYNLDEKADEFAAWFRQQAYHYRHNDLLHTYGRDFAYQLPHANFKNADKLIDHINSDPKYNMNIIYDTPINYIN